MDIDKKREEIKKGIDLCHEKIKKTEEEINKLRSIGRAVEDELLRLKGEEQLIEELLKPLDVKAKTEEAVREKVKDVQVRTGKKVN
jgi:uncharacterized coiled-coil DUF342 family protein